MFFPGIVVRGTTGVLIAETAAAFVGVRACTADRFAGGACAAETVAVDRVGAVGEGRLLVVLNRTTLIAAITEVVGIAVINRRSTNCGEWRRLRGTSKVLADPQLAVQVYRQRRAFGLLIVLGAAGCSSGNALTSQLTALRRGTIVY
jgi:hypothetical protein